MEGQILVELKAFDSLTPAHSSQLLNDLEAFGIPVGPMLNFGTPHLEIKRLLKCLNQPNAQPPAIPIYTGISGQ
ncbi:GxxExxY protein [Hymenobacter sp. PAMC29290]|nr:GxxExxY protein [Hymenobacter siberiensis]